MASLEEETAAQEVARWCQVPVRTRTLDEVERLFERVQEEASGGAWHVRILGSQLPVWLFEWFLEGVKKNTQKLSEAEWEFLARSSALLPSDYPLFSYSGLLLSLVYSAIEEESGVGSPETEKAKTKTKKVVPESIVSSWRWDDILSLWMTRFAPRFTPPLDGVCAFLSQQVALFLSLAAAFLNERGREENEKQSRDKAEGDGEEASRSSIWIGAIEKQLPLLQTAVSLLLLVASSGANEKKCFEVIASRLLPALCSVRFAVSRVALKAKDKTNCQQSSSTSALQPFIQTLELLFASACRLLFQPFHLPPLSAYVGRKDPDNPVWSRATKTKADEANAREVPDRQRKRVAESHARLLFDSLDRALKDGGKGGGNAVEEEKEKQPAPKRQKKLSETESSKGVGKDAGGEDIRTPLETFTSRCACLGVLCGLPDLFSSFVRAKTDAQVAMESERLGAGSEMKLGGGRGLVGVAAEFAFFLHLVDPILRLLGEGEAAGGGGKKNTKGSSGKQTEKKKKIAAGHEDTLEEKGGGEEEGTEKKLEGEIRVAALLALDRMWNFVCREGLYRLQDDDSRRVQENSLREWVGIVVGGLCNRLQIGKEGADGSAQALLSYDANGMASGWGFVEGGGYSFGAFERRLLWEGYAVALELQPDVFVSSSDGGQDGGEGIEERVLLLLMAEYRESSKEKEETQEDLSDEGTSGESIGEELFSRISKLFPGAETLNLKGPSHAVTSAKLLRVFARLNDLPSVLQSLQMTLKRRQGEDADLGFCNNRRVLEALRDAGVSTLPAQAEKVWTALSSVVCGCLETALGKLTVSEEDKEARSEKGRKKSAGTVTASAMQLASDAAVGLRLLAAFLAALPVREAFVRALASRASSSLPDVAAMADKVTDAIFGEGNKKKRRHKVMSRHRVSALLWRLAEAEFCLGTLLFARRLRGWQLPSPLLSATGGDGVRGGLSGTEEALEVLLSACGGRLTRILSLSNRLEQEDSLLCVELQSALQILFNEISSPPSERKEISSLVLKPSVPSALSPTGCALTDVPLLLLHLLVPSPDDKKEGEGEEEEDDDEEKQVEEFVLSSSRDFLWSLLEPYLPLLLSLVTAAAESEHMTGKDKHTHAPQVEEERRPPDSPSSSAPQSILQRVRSGSAIALPLSPLSTPDSSMGRRINATGEDGDEEVDVDMTPMEDVHLSPPLVEILTAVAERLVEEMLESFRDRSSSSGVSPLSLSSPSSDPLSSFLFALETPTLQPFLVLQICRRLDERHAAVKAAQREVEELGGGSRTTAFGSVLDMPKKKRRRREVETKVKCLRSSLLSFRRAALLTASLPSAFVSVTEPQMARRLCLRLLLSAYVATEGNSGDLEANSEGGGGKGLKEPDEDGKFGIANEEWKMFARDSLEAVKILACLPPPQPGTHLELQPFILSVASVGLGGDLSDSGGGSVIEGRLAVAMRAGTSARDAACKAVREFFGVQERESSPTSGSSSSEISPGGITVVSRGVFAFAAFGGGDEGVLSLACEALLASILCWEGPGGAGSSHVKDALSSICGNVLGGSGGMGRDGGESPKKKKKKKKDSKEEGEGGSDTGLKAKLGFLSDEKDDEEKNIEKDDFKRMRFSLTFLLRVSGLVCSYMEAQRDAQTLSLALPRGRGMRRKRGEDSSASSPVLSLPADLITLFSPDPETLLAFLSRSLTFISRERKGKKEKTKKSKEEQDVPSSLLLRLLKLRLAVRSLRCLLLGMQGEVTASGETAPQRKKTFHKAVASLSLPLSLSETVTAICVALRKHLLEEEEDSHLGYRGHAESAVFELLSLITEFWGDIEDPTDVNRKSPAEGIEETSPDTHARAITQILIDASSEALPVFSAGTGKDKEKERANESKVERWVSEQTAAIVDGSSHQDELARTPLDSCWTFLASQSDAHALCGVMGTLREAISEGARCGGRGEKSGTGEGSAYRRALAALQGSVCLLRSRDVFLRKAASALQRYSALPSLSSSSSSSGKKGGGQSDRMDLDDAAVEAKRKSHEEALCVAGMLERLVDEAFAFVCSGSNLESLGGEGAVEAVLAADLGVCLWSLCRGLLVSRTQVPHFVHVSVERILTVSECIARAARIRLQRVHSRRTGGSPSVHETAVIVGGPSVAGGRGEGRQGGIERGLCRHLTVQSYFLLATLLYPLPVSKVGAALRCELGCSWVRRGSVMTSSIRELLAAAMLMSDPHHSVNLLQSVTRLWTAIAETQAGIKEAAEFEPGKGDPEKRKGGVRRRNVSLKSGAELGRRLCIFLVADGVQAKSELSREMIFGRPTLETGETGPRGQTEALDEAEQAALWRQGQRALLVGVGQLLEVLDSPAKQHLFASLPDTLREVFKEMNQTVEKQLKFTGKV
uniref:Uncharacterized protein n=1 Tax=Chromera velia CCMP2878 TaxID=1169474 RepID=A0A0G4FL59_9ALVE|eukprot:Cvel_3443.t1-p1 / transcript=Cvel_3443.t1 / gene=Cvel_3443 / organism=Chromera_velia_CCMP2878 / gene_product=hypothetical protein / transcript_product=hypothetical protein / location=Cvel_scaffold138:97559-110321(-) / protein_length=2368 / sequence_SO=supercontig / SO=protein_coding / is_pseudo=false